MIYRIGAGVAPALGEVQAAGPGDTVIFMHDARERDDFQRYWLAAGIATFRGALVKVVAP